MMRQTNKQTTSYKNFTKPVIEEFVFIVFFMKLMGLSSINALIIQRINAVENITTIPSYVNLFGRVAIL